MTEAMTLRAREDLLVSVSEIETVTGDFHTEPGPPFWRIEIDTYCADFEFLEAARNFRDAINGRISAALSRPKVEREVLLECVEIAYIQRMTDKRTCPEAITDAILALIAGEGK